MSSRSNDNLLKMAIYEKLLANGWKHGMDWDQFFADCDGMSAHIREMADIVVYGEPCPRHCDNGRIWTTMETTTECDSCHGIGRIRWIPLE